MSDNTYSLPEIPPLDIVRADEILQYAANLNDQQDGGIFRLSEIIHLLKVNSSYYHRIMADREKPVAKAEVPRQNNLRDHAIRELQKSNDSINDPDYAGMIDNAVMELVEVFITQGHSGFSANLTLNIFNLIANYKTLTPITDDPREWQDHGDNVWQNRRDGSIFSTDGGHTYYDINKSSWFGKIMPRWVTRPLVKIFGLRVTKVMKKSTHADYRRTGK